MVRSAKLLSSFDIFMVSPVLPVTMFVKMALLPVGKTKHLIPATTIAIMIKADQIRLKAIDSRDLGNIMMDIERSWKITILM
jgi:hypothetical protein